MAIEIERKFLVKRIPLTEIRKSENVKQGYIINDKQKVVRVRMKGYNYFLTIKGNITGISRLEFEYPIPENDAEQIFKHLCGTKVIEKIRHYVEYEGHTWEIDEFQGLNEGLIVAEIELKTEMEKFELPDWIGNEVTNDPRYYNMNLNIFPYLRWRKK